MNNKGLDVMRWFAEEQEDRAIRADLEKRREKHKKRERIRLTYIILMGISAFVCFSGCGMVADDALSMGTIVTSISLAAFGIIGIRFKEFEEEIENGEG